MIKSWQLIIGYFKHLAKAKSRFSIHSPFVYQILTEVILSKKKYYAYKEIEMLRNQLLTSNKTIEVTDLGAGSRVNNKQVKQIAQIVKNASKPHKQAKILFEIVNFFKCKNILEIGTSLGISSIYINKGCTPEKHYTLEGCPETGKFAKQNFRKLNINNIEVIIGDFNTTLPEAIKNTEKLDFVFFDGNHQKDPTLKYFDLVLEKAHSNSVFVFDDIYWSKGMEEAWKEIKQHPKVTVTIDLFWMGLVFFKTNQEKEHFLINTLI